MRRMPQNEVEEPVSDYSLRIALRIASSELIPTRLRSRVLRVLGLKVGKCRIAAGGFYGGTAITIEDGVFINRRVFVDASAEVIIREEARIGMEAMILTSTHELGPSFMRAGSQVSLPTVIGKG